MKKFEEEYDKFHKENHNMYKTATEYHKALKRHFKDVMFLEDYQAVKDRLKECEDLRIEANNKAAKEYTLKCEVVEERAELKREIEQLKSQLKKQQPEIPEFVANYIEAAKEDFWTLLSAMDDPNLSSRVGDWLKGGNFNNQEIFAQAWINGYTVAKEKRFYLKAKELLVVGEYDHVEDLWLDFNKNYTPKKSMAHKFTQKEIDSMETGSYEQIEVEA